MWWVCSCSFCAEGAYFSLFSHSFIFSGKTEGFTQTEMTFSSCKCLNFYHLELNIFTMCLNLGANTENRKQTFVLKLWQKLNWTQRETHVQGKPLLICQGLEMMEWRGNSEARYLWFQDLDPRLGPSWLPGGPECRPPCRPALVLPLDRSGGGISGLFWGFKVKPKEFEATSN